MNHRVYVVQENNRIDYSDAERYGEIVFMTAEEIKPVTSSLRNQTILASIRNHMDDFDPSKDRLILTGNPIVIGYAFHLAMLKAQHIVVLQWDRFSGQYREFLFNP